MALLYDRRVTVTVDTVRITGLRVRFEIKKTLKTKKHNTAKLAIYNLSDDTRRALKQLQTVPVRVEAGYPDNISQIFVGDLRNVVSAQEGPDWITRMESGDGEVAMRTARLNKAYRTLTFEQAIKEAAGSLKIGAGNALALAAKGNFQGAIKTLTSGAMLRGKTTDIVDRLARAASLEWSIQDGQLQFLEIDKALQGTAVLLSPQTGLIGSPELATEPISDGAKTQKKRTYLKARALIQPDIVPGRQIQMQSRQFSALYRCEEVTFTGDTHGQDWYADIEATPLRGVMFAGASTGGNLA